MAELKITSQTLTARTAVCKIEGELDAGNFDLLEDEFNKLLDSGILGVAMDLAGLESFCSSGIGAIVNMSRILASREGRLAAVSIKPKVLGTIEMLGLQEVLTLADNMDAARKLLSGIK